VEFGVFVPIQGGLNSKDRYELPRQIVEMSDSSSIKTIWVEDHLISPSSVIEANEGVPKIDKPLEAWTTLAAFSVWTKRVRIGTEVMPLTSHHPAFVAKQACTIDHLSNGRFILGVGWNEGEFRMFGIPFEPYLQRLQKMDEAVRIIISLWTENIVNFDGKFLQVAGFIHCPQNQPASFSLLFGLVAFQKGWMKIVSKYGSGWITPSNLPLETAIKSIAYLKEILKRDSRSTQEIEIAVCRFLYSWMGARSLLMRQ
jgi:alkanesulfonate monooxygenase SsuD/methylene tetrahydromethanopterin reductase-like flavin-dependent oxidoreductase (luciferase family)